MAEERDTYEARADYRRNLAGTMRAQGKSWAAEIAAAVGGSEKSARALVRRYRTSLAEPTGPAPSPHPCGAGL
jgi:transposase